MTHLPNKSNYAHQKHYYILLHSLHLLGGDN